MSCATELLHPANFCPVCGARLAAPPPDGTAATLPGGTMSPVTSVPDLPHEANVVYLPEHGDVAPAPPQGPVPSHDAGSVTDDPPPSAGPPHPIGTAEERGAIPLRPVDPAQPPGPPTAHASAGSVQAPMGVDPATAHGQYERSRSAEVAAAVPAFGSHGPALQPHELVPPPRDEANPFGDFFGDGPSAWLEDEDAYDGRADHGEPRVVGTMLAAGAIAMLLAAWGVWGVALYRGAGGAEAGGFVLLAMLLWIWYLSMPRAQQHGWALRRHAAMQRIVDARTGRLRERTQGQALMRRERIRYRAMRDERTRRINALGEGAYRAFRHNELPPGLQSTAQRVMAIERQMLEQDRRIHTIEAERRLGVPQGPPADVAEPRTDPAASPPQGGHPPT